MLKFKSMVLLASLLLTGCSVKEADTTCHPSPSLATGTFSPKATVKRHNEIRGEVFSGHQIAWSDTLATSAQQYANYLASSGEFQHANTAYGENLFASTHKVGYLEAIYSWYHEKSKYNYASNSCSGVCGHYTQMIWKQSRTLGCGKATYTKGGYAGGTIVVCRYSPSGNYMGERPY